MKKLLFSFFVAIFALLQSNGYSQSKQLNNSIGISIPTIWNNSEATYYILGNAQKPIGTSVSYGININYGKSISNNLFFSIGLGYFKQRFTIQRATDFYDTITKLLYYTKSYEYDNIDIMFGIGI